MNISANQTPDPGIAAEPSEPGNDCGPTTVEAHPTEEE